MPKGSKSVGALCSELGMDAVAETNFRKETQAYLKDHVGDVPNATDVAIERLAWKYLDSVGGNKHFSWDAALNYQWEASEHRQTILQYVTEIMQMQRWYIIDRLHKRVNGAVNCPGCLLHSPKPSADWVGTDRDARIDDTVISEGSDASSIHHVTSKNDTPQRSESRKRTRASLDYATLSGSKRRKSGAADDGNGTVEVSNEESQPQAISTAHNDVLPNARASGFTPVNPTIVVEVQQPRKPETPAAAQASTQTRKYSLSPDSLSLTLKDFNLSMRYRGKVWHFNSIAHKARVLEKVLLQEEKDVDSYPILAFSKSAKKGAFGGEDESNGDETALKDYFRFYTHFMNERFPGNEKILLENGVKPSA